MNILASKNGFVKYIIAFFLHVFSITSWE